MYSKQKGLANYGKIANTESNPINTNCDALRWCHKISQSDGGGH